MYPPLSSQFSIGFGQQEVKHGLLPPSVRRVCLRIERIVWLQKHAAKGDEKEKHANVPEL